MVSTSSTCSGSSSDARHRRHREGRDQRADQRIAVGPRHRTEDLAFDALHGEQRDECRDDDRGGEEHRPVDLQRADQDQAQPIGPARQARAIAAARRIAAPPLLGQMLQQRLPVLRPRLEIPIDVLDQDHRGIDDDAEIDGADRQQVGVLAAQHQDDDAEEQRERNVDADDDGAAQIAEEDPLDEEDQQAAEDEVVQHRAVVTATSEVRS